MKETIIVVEDELDLLELLEYHLTKEGYDVEGFLEPSRVEEMLKSENVDLLIMDRNLPKTEGAQFVKQIRQKGFTVPVIFLTAKTEDIHKVEGFEVGADDYITKPFSPKELTARLKAVIRRAVPTSVEEVIEVQGLKLDPVSHRVTANETALEMGPTEFRLLHFFMTHPERVYSREQLLNNVWGTNVYVEDRTVDVHIRRLRKAISDTGHDALIQTVRGAGYRFSARI